MFGEKKISVFFFTKKKCLDGVDTYLYAHREIFSKSYQIKPKSDCIYHFPIDLEPNGCPFAVSNQSENGKYNLISV